MGAGYSIKAKGKTEAELLIYEDIGDSWFGGVTAKQVADDLKSVGAVETIHVRINSAGGDVFTGLAVYRLLVEHKAKVVVHIDGLAASIASVIAMAGDEIEISEAGFVMVHNAWAVSSGSSADFRTLADLLDTTSNSIRDVYVARTGRPADEIAALMDAETWMTAGDAVAKGFATRMAENLRIAARVDPSKHKFEHVPAALLGTPNSDAARDRIAAMRAKMRRAA